MYVNLRNLVSNLRTRWAKKRGWLTATPFSYLAGQTITGSNKGRILTAAAARSDQSVPLNSLTFSGARVRRWGSFNIRHRPLILKLVRPTFVRFSPAYLGIHHLSGNEEDCLHLQILLVCQAYGRHFSNAP